MQKKTINGVLLTVGAQISKMVTGFVLLKLIAYYLGAAGLGALGHFMSLVAIISMLAGGGIISGVIKYVAEYRLSPRRLLTFISASTFYTIFFSCVFFILGVFFSFNISNFIFGSKEFYWIIILLAFSQIGFAFVNLVIGVSNGLSDTKNYAKIQIYGNIIGLPIAYLLVKSYGIHGAALGMLVILAAQFLPAYYIYRKSSFKDKFFNQKYRKHRKFNYRKLFSFTIMLIASVLAFPVVEILIRERLIKNVGYAEAGIWQGAIKLSNAYLSFFSVFLAYYFMPSISAENNKKIIKKQVFKTLTVVVVIFLLGASIFYVFRRFLIPLLLSKDFEPLEEFILFQLIGDIFKISAYVVGFVGVAKAATKLYISAEIFQSFCFFSLAWIFGVYQPAIQAVFFGYMLTYILYFIVSFVVFLIWVRR